MNFTYILFLLFGVVYFIIGFIIIKKYTLNKNRKKVNLILSLIIVCSYLATILLSIQPANGYNLQWVTPISNVSPFLFAITFISLFVPYKAKNNLYKILCFFMPAMLFAGLFSTAKLIILNQNGFFWFILSDEISHLTFVFLTYFLLKTKQVELKKQDIGVCVLIFTVLVIGVIIINLIYNTRFFGLNFYGAHAIYGLVISKSPIISAITYYICLLDVIFIGYFASLLFKKNTKKIRSEYEK